mgnify:FL=1
MFCQDIIIRNNEMSKRIFLEEEIREISGNKNVSRCSKRSITWKKEFKERAVRLNGEGTTPQEIFRQAGFNLAAIGRETPKGCLKRWNKVFRKKGADGFVESRGRHGGRKPKPKDLTDADKIKRLEAENAYLKAENAFLARLRAARRTE